MEKPLGKITVEIDHEEMGFLSIALDRWNAEPGIRTHDEARLKAIRDKWDSLYRSYHNLAGMGVLNTTAPSNWPRTRRGQ